MARAGVNGFRLNFSHAQHDHVDQQIEWIRRAGEAVGKPVAILQDLQGPKVRLGALTQPEVPVKVGDRLTLDYAVESENGLTLPVQYNLAEKVQPGQPLYLFDGKVRTTVVEVPTDTAVVVDVQNDGVLMALAADTFAVVTNGFAATVAGSKPSGFQPSAGTRTLKTPNIMMTK